MELRTYIENYIRQSAKKKSNLKKARNIGTQELIGRMENYLDKPNKQNLIILIRGLTTSGIYISRSFLSYLVSYLQLDDIKLEPLTKDEKVLLELISEKKKIESHSSSQIKIFQCIFKDLLLQHADEEHRSPLRLKKFNSTLVLVSGVFNEIFSTSAFERGAEHLSKNLGINYICPKVYGTKSVSHNAKVLEEQLITYCNDNPEEKLWIIAFSKGGVDALHFLAQNSEFAKEKITGLSTIASPILGTSHLEHKVLKYINNFHKYDESKLYKYFEKKSDLLFKEFQQSLSKERQKKWFQKNHNKLPPLNFYTALAMEANWKESHFWMILTKLFFQNKKINDGVVEAENALFPSFFNAYNLGVVKGHHLIGTRSSTYNQEALLEAHVIYLQYLGLLT